jgi:hypothetical protein
VLELFRNVDEKTAGIINKIIKGLVIPPVRYKRQAN